MAIFGKDKPAGDTQPEAGSSGKETLAAPIDTITCDGYLAPPPVLSSTVEGANLVGTMTQVTLKTGHTHAGVMHLAGEKLLVSQSDVETLRYLGAID